MTIRRWGFPRRCIILSGEKNSMGNANIKRKLQRVIGFVLAFVLVIQIYMPVAAKESNPSITVPYGMTVYLKSFLKGMPSFDDLVWKSSNTSVATIDEDAVFRSVGSGVTTISVSSQDYSYTIKCDVTVEDKNLKGTHHDNVKSANVYKNTARVVDAVLGKNTDIPVEYIVEGKVNRMYDPNRGEHFYTKNDSDAAYLVRIGWNHEADGDFEVVSATATDAIPVYRLYNPNHGGMHFYTEKAEDAIYLKNNGWNYEGISHYVYDKSSSQGITQYRLYNPNSPGGEHFWTTSLDDCKYLTDIGWIDEGPCWKIK